MLITEQQEQSLRLHADCSVRLLHDARTQHDKHYWEGYHDAWEVVSLILFPVKPKPAEEVNHATR